MTKVYCRTGSNPSIAASTTSTTTTTDKDHTKPSEDNHVGQIVWHGSTDNNPTNIATEHEYVACYAANKEELDEVWKSAEFGPKAALQRIGAELIEAHPEPERRQREYSRWLREHRAELKPLDRYKFIDDAGVFTGSQSVHNPGREGYRYDVLHPGTGKACRQPLMGYRFPQATMTRLLAEDRVLFGEDESKIIELKVHVDDYQAKLVDADSLTAERVRRVIGGVPGANHETSKAGFGGAFSYYELGPPMLEEILLEGEKLPSYEALGLYIFFTATGEEARPEELDRERCFQGSAGNSDFFLMYEPDAMRLRDLALDMDFARGLPAANGRRRIVYAPARYLDEEFLDHYAIKFCQLPFEIYRMLADA